MAEFLTPLVVEDLVGGRFVRIYEPFRYYSDILKREVEIPVGFIFDYESVPLVRASSKHGGTIHDYFCRKDSVPVVTKQVAADLYLEAQELRDSMLNEGKLKSIDRWFRRNFKTLVVRVAPGYFHKLSVLATYDEVAKEV